MGEVREAWIKGVGFFLGVNGNNGLVSAELRFCPLEVIQLDTGCLARPVAKVCLRPS